MFNKLAFEEPCLQNKKMNDAFPGKTFAPKKNKKNFIGGFFLNKKTMKKNKLKAKLQRYFRKKDEKNGVII